MRNFVLAFSFLMTPAAFAAGQMTPLSLTDTSSMQIRPDGQYDVICADGTRETVTAVDVQIGNLCPNHAPASNTSGIVSLQKRPDGQFNVVCKDNSVIVASTDDIMAGKVCAGTAATPVDLIWVVGGMTEQEANFGAGVGSFLNDFLAKSLSWHMAVLGSASEAPPYLGMPAIFDNTAANPLPTVLKAISDALRGYDGEQIFDPLVMSLNRFPSFVRTGAKLVVIISNDAPEASKTTKSSADVMQTLRTLKGGSLNDVVVYGIMGATDLKCLPTVIDSDWNYAGSEYESLIKGTGGQVYSLCSDSLATTMNQLKADLYRRLNVH